LHVASINRVKDPATLLRAVRLVADQQPDLELDWVGVDTLSGMAQRMAASLDLADRVHFHGFRPVDQIAPLYRRAHLYLQSSLHESQGVAVCEAAAAGLPTVGTAVGLVAELAPDAALAVPVADPQSLAGGILELLHDTSRRESIGRRAQAWVRAHDADWTAAQFEALYANTLAA
jgi:glycosyltransferase involved in cell wall biosynthesis